VCDFKTVRPVLHTDEDTAPVSGASAFSDPFLPDSAFARFRVRFSKLNEARFFGHLELASIIQRAVKRAGLTVKYSQGFNPSMRLAFDNALPVGMESEEEFFTIFLDRRLSPAAVQTALNQQLPGGLTVTDCRPAGKNLPDPSGTEVYRVQPPPGALDKNTVDAFLAKKALMVEDTSKKGKIRRTDLRKAVSDIARQTAPDTITMTMLPFEGRQLRPTAILKHGFGLPDPVIARTRIRKLRQG
jgi:radical SAM-linked protein